MPIYIKANLACNFACRYCYEHPFKPQEFEEIDWIAVEKTIRDQHQKHCSGNKGQSNVGLHGGEPLIMPKDRIEQFLKMGYDLDGRSSIQTNGYNIDEDIIGFFKKYNTGVGVSIDGPWPLNELRGKGTLEERKKQTERILANIDRLLSEKINVSVISVIHKANALGDRRETLKNWVKELHNKRISGRLNPCCCGKPEIDLTPEEAADFYSDMYDFMLRNGIGGWSPFRDMVNSLRGEQSVVCVFKSCSAFCTPSCIPVLKDGSMGVCLRLYTDGKTYLRSEQKDDIRDRVLSQTDCAGCPYWLNCYGGCVGLSIDFDWRNKDRFCLMYKTLFERIENTFKSLGIDVKKKEVQQPRQQRKDDGSGGHWDGDEHLDGSTRHLDSSLQDKPRSDAHTDGVEHLDKGTRHLDG